MIDGDAWGGFTGKRIIRWHDAHSLIHTTLSIVIARTTANTLLHGANTLLVTGHTF